MLEAVEDGLCLLEVSDVLDALDVVRCMLEAVEGEVCWLGVMEVSEVIRCVLLCMLEAVEGALCLLEVLEVLDALDVMRCMLGVSEVLEAMRLPRGASSKLSSAVVASDVLCSVLLNRGFGDLTGSVYTLFRHSSSRIGGAGS